MKSRILLYALMESRTVAIAGHVRPDGDCVGSCMGLYNYIKENFPKVEVQVYLEEISDSYKCLNNIADIRHTCQEDKVYDLLVTLDTSDEERVGVAKAYLHTAKTVLNLDHHISNTGFGTQSYVDAMSSSASEVLFELLEEDKISKSVADAIYMGIICDSGVFKHSNTSRRTMEVAGILLEKGVRSDRMIDEVFYQKTYIQNQLLGRCLMESIMILDGRCIVSSVSQKILEFFQASSKDLEGVIDQLRVTKGVEVAILLTEIQAYTYKISLRSNDLVDVNQVANVFGGGGHIRASGCTMHGSRIDIINNLTREIERQLN